MNERTARVTVSTEDGLVLDTWTVTVDVPEDVAEPAVARAVITDLAEDIRFGIDGMD